MFKFFLNLPVLIILFNLMFFPSCSGNVDQEKILDLSGNWKIIDIDDKNASSAGYDDSRAKSVEIPGNWDYILERNKNLAATVWIRKKIIIPSSLSDRQYVLSLGAIPVADETYFNGIYIGGKGKIPDITNPMDYEFAWYRDRTFTFPSQIVNYGSENVISIRIFSHIVNGIKEGPKLTNITTWYRSNWFREYIPNFYNINPFFLVLTPYIFFFILIRGKKERNNLLIYSIVIALAYFAAVIQYMGIPHFSNGIYRFKIFMILYLLIDLFLVLVIQEFFNVKFKWVIRIFSALLIIVGALITLSPDSRSLISNCGPLLMVLLLAYMIHMCVIFIYALVNDPRRYWFLSFAAVILILSVTKFIYSMLSYQMYKMSFTIFFNLPTIFMAAIFVYQLDFLNIRKERDSLAKIVLKNSLKIKQLSSRLNENDDRTKPRDAIYDLIDYLDSNFYEPYDRKELAQKFELNEDYLGQLFKNTTGTNIASYINEKRINAAKQMLAESDSQVIDIAYHVGFDNLTYFHRLFKKHTGVTPRKYRQDAGSEDRE